MLREVKKCVFAFTIWISASVEIDVQAQAHGILEQILFQDGQLVEEGDLLFVIQQNVYEAQLKSANARLVGVTFRMVVSACPPASTKFPSSPSFLKPLSSQDKI